MSHAVFSIVTEVLRGHEDALDRLLRGVEADHARNGIIDFTQLTKLHFASFTLFRTEVEQIPLPENAPQPALPGCDQGVEMFVPAAVDVVFEDQQRSRARTLEGLPALQGGARRGGRPGPERVPEGPRSDAQSPPRRDAVPQGRHGTRRPGPEDVPGAPGRSIGAERWRPAAGNRLASPAGGCEPSGCRG